MVPITLVGNKLGLRHQHLNRLIQDAYDKNVDFEQLQYIPESSPVSRLFKIELASKLRNVDYILKTLKDDDMLYVSRALKSKWLLEPKYETILNPQYLKEKLYPEMTTTAVTKLQHWIHLNLNDEERNRNFYQFYKEKNSSLALKFLFKCPNELISSEFNTIMNQITPGEFKILCDKCPEVAKIYFDGLTTDEDLIYKYLKKEIGYFNSLKCILKTNADLFLDITEKYYNSNKFKTLSPSQTKYIVRFHKERFMQKPEIYTTCILNMKMLSMCLTVEEAKALVIKLAQAKYLKNSGWFSYKTIEPLLKRIEPKDRAAFKKKVFVDEDIGEMIEDWPYRIPCPPILIQKKPTIFEDYQHTLNKYTYNLNRLDFRCMLKKRKCAKWATFKRENTMLDKLFDEYRFANFDKTLFELRKRIPAESSAQNRQYMMLVLVSKTGGRIDQISSLMDLLIQHKNEANNIRVAVVRSLVKRAQVWRLPEDIWLQLQEICHGLGIDGTIPEIECIEGFHAVVIRQLLLKGQCDRGIFLAYLKYFSTLVEYSLSKDEKVLISNSLTHMLFNAACNEISVLVAVNLINKLLDTLTAYKLSIQQYPGLVSMIEYLAKLDLDASSYIIKRLFNAKIARRELFKTNFKIIQSEDSYINALYHDTGIISVDKFIYELVHNKKTYKKFLSKVAIYFHEDGGLANQIVDYLKTRDCDKKLAKPLCLLIGEKIEDLLRHFENSLDNRAKIFVANLKANVHLTRPPLNFSSYWSSVGAKALANKTLVCRDKEINSNINELLKSKRTLKLAIHLSKRNGNLINVLTTVGHIRPTVVIKTGIVHIHKENVGKKEKLEVWKILKPLIQNFDLTVRNRIYLRSALANANSKLAYNISEYSIVMFNVFKKLSKSESLPYLCQIEKNLQNMDKIFIENLLLNFLKADFVAVRLSRDYTNVNNTCLFLRIIVKYLLLCKHSDDQKYRLTRVADQFFDKMEEIWKSALEKNTFYIYFDELLMTFKYNLVFMNTNYVSPMPVMEKVISCMINIFPREKYFKKYANMHLTMLYYKAIRKSIEKAPEVFDNKENMNETVNVVGNYFGKYIAHEVRELTVKYFDSVIFLYQSSLQKYLDKYFGHVDTDNFKKAIVNGILTHSKGKEAIVGIYLLKENMCWLKSLSEIDLQTKMLICGELFVVK